MITPPYSLVGDELLVSVLKEFPKNTAFFKSEEDLMLAFYEASLKPGYKTLLKNYPFDKNGAIPYSRDISEGLDTLITTGILNYLQFQGYLISKAADIRFEKFIAPKLNKSQKKKIKDLSDYLKKEFKKR